MVMVGSFQEHLEHSTLKPCEINVNNMLEYPAVNEYVKPSLDRLIDAAANVYAGSTRFNITFRTIKNHCTGPNPPRCPLRPAHAVAMSLEPPPTSSAPPPVPPPVA